LHRSQPKTPADILNTDTITKSQRKAIRKAIKHSDPMSLREAEVELPDQTPEEYAGRQRLFVIVGPDANRHRERFERMLFISPRRLECVFYSDGGGFQATDESNLPLPEVYHMGIIDILTKYDIKKRIEHRFKSLMNDSVRQRARACGVIRHDSGHMLMHRSFPWLSASCGRCSTKFPPCRRTTMPRAFSASCARPRRPARRVSLKRPCHRLP